MPPGRLPREVFQACPTGRRPRGRPRTRWRDYVSRLAWERLGVPPEELEEVSGVPMSTVASIIHKWKKFRTTRTLLPRAGRLSKLKRSGEKGLSQGGDQEPDGHSVRAPAYLCRERRTFQKDNHLCSNPPIRPVW
ncbi:hypothetical protein L3Q82_000442 [Scortum barcoo]|uniref:Uncharacterized protein n=1 Tax=Scortum barcoo TaxID=214431 RepID=A0ACB8WEV6_9TELE|nr:hypothetical protein L3Q82_000442 [Scortum barcoo]